MITTLDRPTLARLRSKIDAALAAIGAEEGLVLTCGNATFTPQNATFKLMIATKSDDGTVRTREAEEYTKYASIYGLDGIPLHTEFVVRGERFRIEGLLAKARRMPVLARRVSDGKGFKFEAESVKRGVAVSQAAAKAG